MCMSLYFYVFLMLFACFYLSHFIIYLFCFKSYFYYFKQSLNIKYFGRILPLPHVLPDSLSLPNNPTLSFFSTNKNPVQHQPSTKQESKIKLSPSKTNYNQINIYKTKLSSIMCWSTTHEHEACSEVVNIPVSLSSRKLISHFPSRYK